MTIEKESDIVNEDNSVGFKVTESGGGGDLKIQMDNDKKENMKIIRK